MTKLALVQSCPRHAEIDYNLSEVEHIASECEADIVVFPELSLSGYCFSSFEQTRALSQQADSARFDSLRATARIKKKTLVIGFIEQDGERVYNAALCIMAGSGKQYVYRKTHLFYKERFCFHEGDSGFQVVYDDEHKLSLGCMICYDWRFPESARSLALRGADLIVCPSNLVTHIWPKVMPARAIENKVYLGVANRWGKEELDGEEIEFNGLSAIYSYNGEVLANAEACGNSIISAEIFAERTRDKSFNAVNDIFTDRRPQFYER